MSLKADVDRQIPVTVVVLTYNAGNEFENFIECLKKQTPKPTEVIVIDSSSDDKTAEKARKAGFTVKVIDKKDFAHGKTRQTALTMAKTDIVCFMTQDALLAERDAIKILVDYLLGDEKIGAVYGRQLPKKHAGPLGTFARLYNYGEESFVNTFADRERKGFKTAFLSDTFAAYKKSILLEVGGFPLHSDFGEDSFAAARMLTAGYKTGYCAEAKVYHSHDYDLKQEWQRSKSLREFHKRDAWILDEFGKPEGEGLRFVVRQAKWLVENGYWQMLPKAFIHNAVKFLGYKLG